MQNDPRATFVGIISDELNACPDRELVLSLPSLEAGWQGAMEDWLVWWFIEEFTDDREHYLRMLRGYRAVGLFFADLAKLHHEQTGESTLLDRNLILQLSRRVLQGMYPSAYEVAVAAKKHPAARAGAAIRRFTTARDWHGG